MRKFGSVKNLHDKKDYRAVRYVALVFPH